MELEYIRDYAMYTAIFGMFSFVWFGWAQENPGKNWRKYIGVSSGIALLVCLIGVYLRTGMRLLICQKRTLL